MAAPGHPGGRPTRAQGARDQQRRPDAADEAAVESGRLSAQRRRNHARHGNLRGTTMKRSILLPLAAFAVSILGTGIAAVSAKPVTYVLPDEATAFKPGPNLETVQGNCGACHSADYIATQPQRPPFKNPFCEADATTISTL